MDEGASTRTSLAGGISVGLPSQHYWRTRVPRETFIYKTIKGIRSRTQSCADS